MSLPSSADDFQPEKQQPYQADEADLSRRGDSLDPYMTPAEAHALMNATRGSTLTRFLDRAEPVLAYIRDHWLGIINTGLALYIGISLLTPLAFAAGMTGPASGIFNAYRFFCAQTPSHSFFIAGYQTCLCSRCLAIYTSILVAGVALTVFRNHHVIRALPWYYWLLGMVPMALDGFTQLFGAHESNLALRLLTGTIFGLTTAWFLFPQIEEAAHQEQPAPNPAAYAAYGQLDH